MNSAKLTISPIKSLVLLLYYRLQVHNSIIVLSKSDYKMSEYKSCDLLWKYKLLEVKDHILSPYCFKALVT